MEKQGLQNAVLCYGKEKKEGYIENNDVVSHQKWINKFKVFVPRVNNIGTELNDDIQNSFIGKPYTICTESYIIIGADLGLDEYSCQNLSSYHRTRFARFFHSLAKVSQDATAKTYRFVPMQDFSHPWTDEMLYKKYGISEEEIAFIDSTLDEYKNSTTY